MNIFLGNKIKHSVKPIKDRILAALLHSCLKNYLLYRSREFSKHVRKNSHQQLHFVLLFPKQASDFSCRQYKSF